MLADVVEVQWDIEPAGYGASIEHDLKSINHRANLRLEYLKRVYDRRSIAERYFLGETGIHLHGLCGRTRDRYPDQSRALPRS